MEVPKIGSSYRTKKNKKPLFANAKYYLTEKVTIFLKKTNTMKKTSKCFAMKIQVKTILLKKFAKLFRRK